MPFPPLSALLNSIATLGETTRSRANQSVFRSPAQTPHIPVILLAADNPICDSKREPRISMGQLRLRCFWIPKENYAGAVLLLRSLLIAIRFPVSQPY